LVYSYKTAEENKNYEKHPPIRDKFHVVKVFKIGKIRNDESYNKIHFMGMNKET